MKSDDSDTEIVKSQINFSPFYFDLNLCNASGFDATETQFKLGPIDLLKCWHFGTYSIIFCANCLVDS